MLHGNKIKTNSSDTGNKIKTSNILPKLQTEGIEKFNFIENCSFLRFDKNLTK